MSISQEDFAAIQAAVLVTQEELGRLSQQVKHLEYEIQHIDTRFADCRKALKAMKCHYFELYTFLEQKYPEVCRHYEDWMIERCEELEPLFKLDPDILIRNPKKRDEVLHVALRHLYDLDEQFNY